MSGLLLRAKFRGARSVAIWALVVVTPWTVRNAVQFGRFVPVAIAGSGNNLMLGTISVPLGSGGNLVRVYGENPEVRAILDLDETDEAKEARLRQAGMRRILAGPGRWIYTRVTEYPRLLLDPGEYLPGALRFPRLLRSVSLFLSGGLIVLAVLGTLRDRSNWRETAPVLSAIVYLLAVHAPILSFRRMGVPIITLLCLFVASGAKALGDSLGRFYPRPRSRVP